MSLEDWLRNGWLIEHHASAQEIKDLLAVVGRDLRDSQVTGLSPDWKLSIAYNAALQAATAALAAAGYRASRDAHHYRTIQSLAHTVGTDSALVVHLDAFRKKRNIGDYERAGIISEQEATEMLLLATDIYQEVQDWLHKNHPELSR